MKTIAKRLGQWLHMRRLFRISKCFFVTVAAMVGISSSSFGITYFGSMICTVTDSSDPLVLVGSVFENFYQYDSASVDGVFYSSPLRELVSGTPSVLSGLIYEAQGGWPSAPQYVQTNIVDAYGAGAGINNHITVLNGSITDFFYDNQFGGGNTRYTGDSFLFYSSGPTESLLVSGTVIFSMPTIQVFEDGMTAAMLGSALVGLALMRRRFSS